MYKSKIDPNLPYGEVSRKIRTKAGKKTKKILLAKDPDFYKKLGKMGGNKVKEIHGTIFYKKIRRKVDRNYLLTSD